MFLWSLPNFITNIQLNPQTLHRATRHFPQIPLPTSHSASCHNLTKAQILPPYPGKIPLSRDTRFTQVNLEILRITVFVFKSRKKSAINNARQNFKLTEIRAGLGGNTGIYLSPSAKARLSWKTHSQELMGSILIFSNPSHFAGISASEGGAEPAECCSPQPSRSAPRGPGSRRRGAAPQLGSLQLCKSTPRPFIFFNFPFPCLFFQASDAGVEVSCKPLVLSCEQETARMHRRAIYINGVRLEYISACLCETYHRNILVTIGAKYM